MHIAEDIRKAETLPGWVYRDPAVFEHAAQTILPRAWHLVSDLARVKTPQRAVPATLLEGALAEPLLLTRDAEDRLHCLSNVCTHRGNLVVEGETNTPFLRCRYHGRRFGLDGRFLSMPEFEGVTDFPAARDDLPRVPFGTWAGLVFAALDPEIPFEDWIAPVAGRLPAGSFEEAAFDASRSRDYLVHSNWALYVDNYLEGFHIPYVHASLNEALDYGSYRTELFARGSLQLGLARGAEEAFPAPASGPDAGQRVAAYYFWLWPNTMLNFYPWGLSVNVVKPLAPDRTKVSFLTYITDPKHFDRGAGAGLDRVEREDESVVESVQAGVGSRLYRRGRYSPARETGVHHFHRLLAQGLALAPSQPPY